MPEIIDDDCGWEASFPFAKFFLLKECPKYVEREAGQPPTFDLFKLIDDNWPLSKAESRFSSSKC